MPGESVLLFTGACSDWMFQSTPGNYAGRIQMARPDDQVHRRFNPLPAIMPGESLPDEYLSIDIFVSIHSRQLCRENPDAPTRWCL